MQSSRSSRSTGLVKVVPSTAVDADFDAQWYLTQYPDVVAAGMDPWVHYQQFGRTEGRLPRRNRALAWEHHLWRGAHDVMLARLVGLISDLEANEEELLHARWALARWFAFKQQWPAVVDLLMPEGELLDLPMLGPGLLALEACRLTARDSKGRSRLKRLVTTLKVHYRDHADVFLAQSNVLSDKPINDAKRLGFINRMYRLHGLATLSLTPPTARLSLDCLSAGAKRLPKRLGLEADLNESNLVSVIVPLYNAQKTIGTALRSLFEQTWRPLQIIVVDDHSTDQSVAVVQRLQARCPSGVTLQLLQQSTNRGAYAARNLGLTKAKGAYITTHDSDDWSHPDKIELQVKALIGADRAVASLSHWVRTSPRVVFGRWRVEPEGWTYRNISSLMFNRRVFDTLGYWDEVKVNADTEFHERLLVAFGADSLIDVLPGVPLSFGRADPRSLSQHSDTHLVTQFIGVRRDYMASARRWHQAAKGASDLYIARDARPRPFLAPPAIVRGRPKSQFIDPIDEVQASGLFDAGWYLRNNIDLQQHALEALEHYCQVGWLEGRDPGPLFSTSGYLAQYPDSVKSRLNPVLHYLRVGQARGYTPLPLFKGLAQSRKSRSVGKHKTATVLLVGHAAGESLYGAERSLFDVACSIRRLGLNLVVALPSAVNTSYLDRLRKQARAVAVAPFGWWQLGKEAEPQTVAWFARLISDFDIDLVHVNTTVLDEPLVAAREAGVPCVVHSRELPAHDLALCETLNASAEKIGKRVAKASDVIIANSVTAASWLQPFAGSRIETIPNTIDMEPFVRLRPASAKRSGLRVGMLSSHTPKKGLQDLQKVASELVQLDPAIRFLLFGPRTAALDALLAQGLTNIDYRGYVQLPEEAFSEIDVLINLSSFQESFGRTVLEAMAAARTVVVYDWGALPELVDDGVTGLITPYRDTVAVVQALLKLRLDPQLRAQMGHAARKRAVEKFGWEPFDLRMGQLYARLGVHCGERDR